MHTHCLGVTLLGGRRGGKQFHFYPFLLLLSFRWVGELNIAVGGGESMEAGATPPLAAFIWE